MTDREKNLTILDRFYRGRGGSLLTKDECEAMEYAISSIKTDLKYDLLYEGEDELCNGDCDNCDFVDGDYCRLNEKSTTKNDLGVDCISRAYLYNRIKKIDHDEDYECDEFGGSRITYHTCDWDEVLREIEDAPPVTPQEPFINKPCVSEKVCKHDKNKALDKLRAEIKDWQTDIHDNEYEADKYDFVFERIFEIIDEYKSESER